MIIGGCPYCDEFMSNPIVQKPPQVQKIIMSCCGNTVWLWHSRINPKAYTNEQFLKDFEIDEQTKTIRPKG